MYPPPTRLLPAPRQQPSTLIGNFVVVRTEKRWRTHEKLGGSRFVRRSFSADKYEPTPYVCQACKHNILCLSFRSLARCGRVPSPAMSTVFSEDSARRPKLVRNRRRAPEPASGSS